MIISSTFYDILVMFLSCLYVHHPCPFHMFSDRVIHLITIRTRAVVIAWQLDLQLPMQSVLIITNEVFSIQYYVIKCVSDLRQVGY